MAESIGDEIDENVPMIWYMTASLMLTESYIEYFKKHNTLKKYSVYWYFWDSFSSDFNVHELLCLHWTEKMASTRRLLNRPNKDRA